MITYTWSVRGLEVIDENNLSGVAIIAYFACDGEDESGLKGHAESDVRLGEPDPRNFTDIDSVTANQAVQWTLSALGDSGVEKFEEMVAKQIESQLAPRPRNVHLPWMPDQP